MLLLLLGFAAWIALAPPPPIERPAPAPSSPVAARPAPGLHADDPPPAEAEEPDAELVEFPADAPRMLYGQVTNPDGDPVAGATVRVRTGDQTLRASTDPGGSYRLYRVPANADVMEVSARGYEPRAFERPSFPPEAKVRWDVVLEPAAGVYGIVLAGGKPADGAWVWVRRAGVKQALGKIHADGEGRFALPWPGGTGQVKVYATHGAHGSASVEIDSPGEVTLTLNGGGFISGRVVDDHGDPVSEFSITTDKYVMRTGGPPAQSFDSGGGTFNLGPVAPGKVRIWVAANGYQPASLAGLRVKSGETTSGVVVRLKRSGTVSGRVTDATTGRPIAGALVMPAEWRSGTLAESVGAVTGLDGTFRLTALPGGRSSLRATAEGYRPLLTGGANAPPGKEIRHDFALTPQSRSERPGAELTGIGAVLKRHRQGVEIGDVVRDGPAAEVLEKGDVVVMVGDLSARKAGLRGVVQAIRGEEGTDVVLWVKRRGRGEPERVVLTRARVLMPDRHHRRR